MAFLWCQWTKAFCRTFQISFLEGKILFCSDPVAMEVSEGDGSVKVSPLSWRCRKSTRVSVLDDVDAEGSKCKMGLRHQPIEGIACGCTGYP